MTDLKLRNPIIFSLDVVTLSEAEKWIDQVGNLVGCIKLGPRILLQASRNWIQSLSKVVPLFIDCKFFDIPSTMRASIEMSFELGASIVTVHSLCGKPTLIELANLQKTLSKDRPILITPVTILTSFSEKDLTSNFTPHPVHHHVQILIDLISESGLNSVVCSPYEAALARAKGLLPITPGIRAFPEQKHDQNRTLSAKAAINKGAWGLVIGRPILSAQDPQSWIRECLQELER
jgi:orotidine-5'-phosphate decarboxylase